MFSSRLVIVAKVVSQLASSFNRWNYVTCLLNGNGFNGQGNNTFLDSSSNNFTITRTGTPTQGSFSPFGTCWSNKLNGSTDYVRMSDSAVFNPGSSDFTIEMWINPTSISGSQQRVFQFGDNHLGTLGRAMFMNLWSNGSLSIQAPQSWSTGNLYQGAAGIITINKWHHVVWVRSGSTHTVYVNGVSYLTVTNAGTMDTSATFNVIGTGYDSYWGWGNSNNAVYFNGSISNFRYVVGTALYTAAFNPPTQPLTAISGTQLLCCNSNSFKDNSANNSAITVSGTPAVSSFSPFNLRQSLVQQSAISFNGTSYLTILDNANLRLGSSDFTMECWCFPTTLTLGTFGTNGFTAMALGCVGNYSAVSLTFGANYIQTALSTTGSGYALVLNSPTNIVINQWYHVAVSRLGNTITLFINGVSVATGSLTGAIYPGTINTIGSLNTIYTFGGLIAQARVLSGTALYTSNFQPSQYPLQPVSGTQLLCCQGDFTDKSANNFTITKVGSPTISTNGPWLLPAPISSVSFNGTTDYLSVADNSSIQLGSSDFTFEFWANPATVTGAYPTLIGWNMGSAGYGALVIFINNSNFGWGISTGNGGWADSGAGYGTNLYPAVQNTWYHIAAVRSGTSFKLYINGVAVSTLTHTGTLNNSTFNYIGYDPGNSYFTGNLRDVRLVKGQALYTANFIPPQQALTAVPGTVLLTCQGDMTDKSTNAFTITQVGTPKVSTLAPTFDNGKGMYFNGSTDYLSAPYTASTDLPNLVAGNFTIECWVYPTAALPTNCAVLSTSTGNTTTSNLEYNLMVQDKGVGFFAYYGAAWNIQVECNIIVKPYVWAHLAFVKSGSNRNIYINGVPQTLRTNMWNTPPSMPYATVIGSSSRGDYNIVFPGYISNMRLTKSALYTAAFTPPTSPLLPVTNTQLLLSGTNSGVIDSTGINDIITVGTASVSTANSKFGGSSMYFPGTSGSYLQIPDKTEMQLGSSDFTVECWFNSASVTTVQNLIALVGYSNAYAFSVYINASQIGFGASSAGSSWDVIVPAQYGPTLINNTWYHVAVTRSGTTCSLFLNGSLLCTKTVTGTIGNGTVNILGASSEQTQFVNGYIDDFRIIKGQALYTNNFTPTPNSNISADSNSMYTALQITDTQINPNDSGVKFNGSTDYLTATNTAGLQLGNSDFTIECWLNLASTGVKYIYGYESAAQDGIILYTNSSTSLVVALSSDGATYQLTLASSITLVANTTYHVAAVKSGSNVTLYINGSSVGTGTFSGSIFVSGTPTIGIRNTTSAEAKMSGYISNFRIVKGTALYTSTFTPSRTLTAISGTQLLTCVTDMSDQSTNGLTITKVGNPMFVPRLGSFVDSSANNFTITPVGTPAQGSFSPFGTCWSVAFNGSTDSLKVPSSANLALGTSDFTIELWFLRSNTINEEILYDQRTAEPQIVPHLQINTSGFLVFYVNGSNVIVGTTSILPGVWNHIAVARSSSVSKVYLNGVQEGASYTDSNNYIANQITIGGQYAGYSSAFATGNLSNLRVVKGTAIYTSNFIPSTQPLTAISGTQLLTCNSNSFKDNSTNNFAISTTGTPKCLPLSPFVDNDYSETTYGGSMYFNGSTDYIKFTGNSNTVLGSGDFTIEAWINSSVLPTGSNLAQIVDFRPSLSSAAGVLGVSSTGLFWWNGTSNIAINPSSFVANSWYHVSITKASGTLRAFVNGIQCYTGSDSITYSSGSNNIMVGNGYEPTRFFNGQISGLRILKDQALYTANFTVPTAPLTVVTNTQLLLNGTNAIVPDQTMCQIIQPAGNTTVTSSNFKYGSSSMYFPGTTGSYINILDNPSIKLGSSDFTIECWFNTPSISTVQRIWHLNGNSNLGSVGAIGIGLNGSALILYASSNGTSWDQINGVTVSSALASNTWYHLSVARSGNLYYVYLNGSLIYTGTISAALYAGTLNWIGALTYSSQQNFNGYIDDFRITVGKYRYAFPAPTAALT